MSNTDIATMIQAAVAQAAIVKDNNGVYVPNTSIQDEIARLKAENACLTAAKLATQKQPQPVANTPVAPKTHIAAPPASATTPAADAKLLDIIAKFKSAPRADGKPSGALAVKVHSYLHQCGVVETRVREIVESAVSRNVLSRMTIPTSKGTRMMMYFDARERPNGQAWGSKIDPSEAASVASAFGL
jgi:hypothetical protein